VPWPIKAIARLEGRDIDGLCFLSPDIIREVLANHGAALAAVELLDTALDTTIFDIMKPIVDEFVRYIYNQDLIISGRTGKLVHRVSEGSLKRYTSSIKVLKGIWRRNGTMGTNEKKSARYYAMQRNDWRRINEDIPFS
jgi:hypothetical protein